MEAWQAVERALHNPMRKSMNEEPFFVRDGQRELFAILHRPSGAADIGCAIVFCSAFAGEHNMSRRVLVTFARLLASQGFHVLRFDYSGSGDSGGDFRNTTIETYVADTRLAIQALRQRAPCSRVGLLGLRLGSLVGAMTCAADDIDFLVLWAPVVDVRRLFDGLLRSCLATQMAYEHLVAPNRAELKQRLLAGEEVNMGGYLLTGEMIRWADSFEIERIAKANHPPCLVVDMSKTEKAALSADARLWRTSLQHNEACQAVAITEDSFWQDLPIYRQNSNPAFQQTLQWLRATKGLRLNM